MVRSLPWLEDGLASASKSTTAPRPAKKRRIAPPSESSDDDLSAPSPAHTPLQRSTPKLKRINGNHCPKNPTHTPSPSACSSTSPPPSPPPEIPMRPGYRADDQYRMVEDEFDATARLFTAHLHQAAYQELSKLALLRSPTAAKKMARGVDANAWMGAELVRRKEREGREEAVGAALVRSGVKGIAKEDKGRKRGDENSGDGDGREKREREGGEEDDEDEEADEEAEVQRLVAKARNQPTDQWRGTHLASLMSTSSSLEKSTGVSLVGMQGIKSGTRAARGYAAPRSRASEMTRNSGLAGFGKREGGSEQQGRGRGKGREPEDRGDVSESSDSEDLGAPAKVRDSQIQAKGRKKTRPGLSVSFQDELEGKPERYGKGVVKSEPASDTRTSRSGRPPPRMERSALSKLFEEFDNLDRNSAASPARTLASGDTPAPTCNDTKSIAKRKTKLESSKGKIIGIGENEKRSPRKSRDRKIKLEGEGRGERDRDTALGRIRRAADEIPLFMAI